MISARIYNLKYSQYLDKSREPEVFKDILDWYSANIGGKDIERIWNQGWFSNLEFRDRDTFNLFRLLFDGRVYIKEVKYLHEKL